MPCSGHVGSITIAPNKTMRIIATIIGPVKRFVDMEVLVTEMDGVHCPIDPQVWHLYLWNWGRGEEVTTSCFKICRIMENDCIGFLVTNRGNNNLIVEKRSQEICCISVWSKKKLEKL